MDCAICCDAITAATGKSVMSCGHEFHMACLVKWLQKPDGTGNCPYCRAEPSEKERLVAPPADDSDDDDDDDDDDDEEEVATNITALMDAACNGNLTEVIRLLGQGEPVDAKDSDGYTALVYAVINSEDACIDKLIEAGADLLVLSNVYESMDETVIPSLGLALLAACQCNSTAALKAALDAGADPNFAHPTTGITPLMEAISNDGPLSSVDMLLSRGASVFAIDREGWNVFMWFAEKCADTDVMASLLEAAGPAFRPVPVMKVQAAKKIQAVWRGHSTRKQLRTENIVATTLTELMITITC